MFSRVSYLFALALALALARPVIAQQTVDVGSISGRVVDEMGMAIPGVTIVATQRLTNVASTAISDEGGRFRLPYLRIGVYELKASLAGFQGLHPALSVSRRARRLSSPSCWRSRTSARRSRSSTEAPVIESARSQIAATVSEAEVAALPMNGRNFLDLALLVPGVAPANIAQHAALSRNLRGAGHHALCRQPAQPLEQLRRRWPVGQ